MTLQTTYLGAGSIGATELNPSASITYTVPITVATDSWLVAIESAWKAPATTANFRLAHAVYEDNAGEPGLLLNSYLGVAQSLVIDVTARWVTTSIGVWLPAGNYHVGASFPIGIAAPRLLMTTGGASGDGHTVDSNGTNALVDGDFSTATITATTDTYSIRAVLITEVGGQNIAVGQTVERELANPVTPAIDRQVVLGQATEAETANPITALVSRIVPVGQAVEVELALTITPVITGPQFVNLGQAVERELAQAITPIIAGIGLLTVECEILSPTAACAILAPTAVCEVI